MSTDTPLKRSNASSAPPTPGAEPQTGSYSAEILQRVVDQAAYFNLHSTPHVSESRIAIRSGGKDILGVRGEESLRRFHIHSYKPTIQQPFRATNVVGEIAGTFTHRWMFIPDDYSARPDSNPPSAAFDPSRSQRFVMLDGICRLGDEKDGFSGFGTGKTYPVNENGHSQLLVTAIGTLIEGVGKFK